MHPDFGYGGFEAKASPSGGEEVNPKTLFPLRTAHLSSPCQHGLRRSCYRQSEYLNGKRTDTIHRIRADIDPERGRLVLDTGGLVAIDADEGFRGTFVERRDETPLEWVDHAVFDGNPFSVTAAGACLIVITSSRSGIDRTTACGRTGKQSH